MEPSEETDASRPPSMAMSVRTGAIAGWLVVGVIVFVIALIAGADFVVALIVGLAVGAFVGGGLGLMYAGRLAGDSGGGRHRP